jgi:SHS family lactate transporter-like MFS transporter
MNGNPALASVPRDQWRAVIAGFLGWTLDAFDYFLVTISVVAIAADFHVEKKKIIASLTFTLLFRPVGALIFGLLADRYGRRLPMILCLVFYSMVEVATGFATTLWAFLVLRALFGIGMGGEWGVGTSLVMEKVSPRWRGVLSGLLQEGYAAGLLLASLVGLLVLPKIGDKVVFHLAGHACYGWRILFFIGGLPALLALFVRIGIAESEVWQQTRHVNWSQLFLAIVQQWKLLLMTILLLTVMMCSSHGTQDLYPTFLKMDFHFSDRKVLTLNAVTAVGAILGGVLFGLWSDHIGRRKAMVAAFLLAILVIPLWACWPESLIGRQSVTKLLIGGFLIQFGVQGAWGIIPAHLSELSPDAVRGFVPGFAYQMGALCTAPLPWIQESLHPASEHGYGKVLAVIALIVFLSAILITSLCPERCGVKFGEGHPLAAM